MQINCNFVTVVGLTNDEPYVCLVHGLRVEKHCRAERIVKMFSNKWAHLNYE